MRDAFESSTDVTIDVCRRWLLKEFGSRERVLLYTILHAAVHRTPCDVTFYDRPPALNVTFRVASPELMNPSFGAKTWQDQLSAITLSDGLTVSLKEIWVVFLMPKDGFTEEELAAVDLRQAEAAIGERGETMQEMIRKTYRCVSRVEEDDYLRRFIAS